MKRSAVLLAALALCAFNIGIGSANPVSAQQTNLDPTTVVRTERPLSLPEGEYDLFQGVNYFKPGAVAPLHSHDGVGMSTVLEGGVVNRRQGEPDKPYKAGEIFLCSKEEPSHAIANISSVPARVLIAFALPKGAPVSRPIAGSTPTPGAPPMTQPFKARMTVGSLPSKGTLVQIAQDFAPGARIPTHTHGGIGLGMVIDGELVVQPQGKEGIVYKPGGIFLEKPGEYARIENAGSMTARLTQFFILSQGAELTTMLQQPTATGVEATATAVATEVPTTIPTPVQEPTAIASPVQEPVSVAQPAAESPVSTPAGMPRTGVRSFDEALTLALTLALVLLALGIAARPWQLSKRR